MSGLWDSMKDGSRRIAETLTGKSVIGRSKKRTKQASTRRRRAAAAAGIQTNPEGLGTAAKRNLSFARARSGRASTLLSENDTLGG